MNVDLPNNVNEFVKNLVLNGRFESEQAAIAEGLRLLMSREKLRADVARGFKQLDDGEWVDGDAVFEELQKELDAIEAKKQGS